MNRENLAPHLTGAFHLGDFHFVPSLGLHETFYGQGQTPNLSVQGQTQYQDVYQTTGTNIRPQRAGVLARRDFPHRLPRLREEDFSWRQAEARHRAARAYRYVTGIGSDFDRFIRFDETELLSNTNDLLLSLTNRLYAKRGDSVQEIFTWELMQKRYFDPDLRGRPDSRPAQRFRQHGRPGRFRVPGAAARHVAGRFVAADQPGGRLRRAVAGRLRSRARSGIVDSTVALDYRFRRSTSPRFPTALVHLNPILTPTADQYGFRAGYGDVNRTGWNGYVDRQLQPA